VALAGIAFVLLRREAPESAVAGSATTSPQPTARLEPREAGRPESAEPAHDDAPVTSPSETTKTKEPAPPDGKAGSEATVPKA
jgi:hypothetical protein